MDTLETHLILHIVSLLSPNDILRLSATCKNLNDIITSSSVIQLKLYSHLYSHPFGDSPEQDNVHQNARDELLQLLATEDNIKNVRPRITNIRLPEGKDVVGVNGDYYLTAHGGNISRWDFLEEQDLVLRTLWWMDQDGELRSKKILMPVRPIQYRVKEDIKQQIIVILRPGTSPGNLIITVIDLSHNDSPQRNPEFAIPFGDAEDFSRLSFWVVPGRRVVLQIKGVMKVVDLVAQRVICEVDFPWMHCMNKTIRFIDHDDFVILVAYVHLDTEEDGRPHMLYYYRLDPFSAPTGTDVTSQISPMAAITLPATTSDFYNYPGASSDPSNTRSRDVDVIMSGPDGTQCTFLRFQVLPLNATRSDISIILPIDLLKSLVAESLQKSRKAKTCV
ncbi:hypothetical protein I302_107306 [Kwoniella bestiolae CBS 10118]|uniref:F-box domain-containing protein n=1 Tax=Kwoniella bestiolae CBS 10118 TaxID=1296100 RepID=A0A1B9FYY0_9TREE|nr:hypothetical protein I302_06958 [Kwoniella bestiolae CBS 10118]OCF23972.1 hypothetical protein I302_06958 [Kwoniella bestiolae CBS 10118]